MHHADQLGEAKQRQIFPGELSSLKCTLIIPLSIRQGWRQVGLGGSLLNLADLSAP